MLQVENFVEVREHPQFMEVYRSEPKLADKMFALLTAPADEHCKRRRIEWSTAVAKCMLTWTCLNLCTLYNTRFSQNKGSFFLIQWRVDVFPSLKVHPMLIIRPFNWCSKRSWCVTWNSWVDCESYSPACTYGCLQYMYIVDMTPRPHGKWHVPTYFVYWTNDQYIYLVKFCACTRGWSTRFNQTCRQLLLLWMHTMSITLSNSVLLSTFNHRSEVHIISL